MSFLPTGHDMEHGLRMIIAKDMLGIWFCLAWAKKVRLSYSSHQF